MVGTSYFERMVTSAAMIARHTDFPGKEEVLRQCLEDLEDLLLVGRITGQQGDVLRGILANAA